MNNVRNQEIQFTNNNSKLLSVIDLHTWFELKKWGFFKIGTVRAVDGVSFDLLGGESIAVVGESGCGKSSLARTLLGLNPVTNGQVLFEGRNVANLKGAELKNYRARVGFIQQDPFAALAPFMTVHNILSEPLIVHGINDRKEREERILQVLEEVRLSPAAEYVNKFPHMLSGGQQQRIVIARALILEPALIIADEPVSMLDASVRVELLNLLKNIQEKRQLSLIFITHDLSTVRHFADRILVMYAGQIVEQAAVDDLLDHPQHPYTCSLLNAISDVNAENAKQQREIPTGEPPSLINPPAGCRFHPRCPKIILGTCDKFQPDNLITRPKHVASCWLYNE